ncbi:cation-transporting P-type ATPase [Desulfobacter hydrogenophilus]|uniref:Cation-transporting P-type ATPase n=1 Tax=Desulfobacter hydrogenophilus TaxID=2291 RepID=A0A328FB39_9BACT|nr:cation-transporting P-type ATPase [Desulfobacter hydrogenophilus]NDY74170.1 cation-transporting P-type ATPase [Desulfobacter hydrogenophilus]QBH12594.1 cation-transporting P-type ATPase [Desulfobacter hydrogenophilus]RAM00237.1 cation-transporting P-type ATPase [Desulfobacter hydrogenophilus]
MSSQGKQIQHLAPDRVYTLLETNPEGLHGEEVEERLLNVGRNSFDIPDRWKMLRNFGKQFTNFFTILLIVSAIICVVAHRLNPGESMNFLGWALFVVALLNAFFSFIQEYRAERAMEALKKFLPQMVEVQRQGQVIKVPAEEIVPGDLLILAEGDKITADARVVEAEGLLVDNAPLTGEANPCVLVHGASSSRLVESNNIAFAGCTVIRGSGKAVVFATGLRTEFGKLAHLSQEIKRASSPLEQETAHMVRVLTVIAVSMGFAFFMYGMVTGRPLWVNLVFMMGIIVANVPEGLLPTFTLSLAMGSLRMARKNVLVKSLNAVEALGAVHVICSDKTGTLTENKLTITELLSPLHGRPLADQEQLDLLTLALAASEVRGIDHLSGDPLDVAVAERLTILGADLEALRERIEHYFTFDVEKRRSAGIMTVAGKRFFVVKGAFEALSPIVVSVRSAKGQEAVDARALGQAEEVLRGMAGQGLRVIALACRELEGGAQDFSSLQDALEKELVLVGFIGIEDPLRKEVPAAVRKCHTAGIDVLLITGDHPDTAQAIARKAGILPQEDDPVMLMTGADLEHLTEAGLMERLGQGTRVFARTTPEQKMKIVAALKTMEKVVAMTGDGVNDAPALKAADVGIAMGRQGTDVARESAQIILLDDNFASIVAGIEEGRTVFGNIKKFTNYVLVSNGPEILPYLLYILLPVPLALNVIQILSIDLGTDIIPSMALGQEPPDSETMNQPPRLREQGLLTLSLIMHSYLFLGLLEGLWSLGLFFYVLTSGGWRFGEDLATTDPLYHSAMGIALSTILLMQIGNLLGRRFARRSGLDGGIFKNRLMLLGIIIQVVFSWATLYFPPLQKILNTGPVPLSIYFLAWFGIILIFGSDYLRKRYLENRERTSLAER